MRKHTIITNDTFLCNGICFYSGYAVVQFSMHFSIFCCPSIIGSGYSNDLQLLQQFRWNVKTPYILTEYSKSVDFKTMSNKPVILCFRWPVWPRPPIRFVNWRGPWPSPSTNEPIKRRLTMHTNGSRWKEKLWLLERWEPNIMGRT